MENLIGNELFEYVNGFDNYNMLHKYMDKCSQAAKHAHENNIRLMIGLQRNIVKKL